MAKAPAFPFSPTEIVIALETFHGYPNVTVRQGTRFRGDNPIVHTWPDRFIADGASDDELTRARQRLTQNRSRSNTSRSRTHLGPCLTRTV